MVRRAYGQWLQDRWWIQVQDLGFKTNKDISISFKALYTTMNIISFYHLQLNYFVSHINTFMGLRCLFWNLWKINFQKQMADTVKFSNQSKVKNFSQSCRKLIYYSLYHNISKRVITDFSKTKQILQTSNATSHTKPSKLWLIFWNQNVHLKKKKR